MSLPKTVRTLRLVAGLAAGLLVATGITQANPAGAADPQPSAVSVPGDFGAQVGCPGDWQPDCQQVQLSRRGNDDVWTTTVQLAAGSYQYKAALNKSWDVNYGAGAVAGGPNIGLVVPAGGAAVTFYYDNATHWVTDTVNTTMVTAAGSFQSELGCPADWSPDCLRSWLEDPDGDGTFTFTTNAIPAGDYQVKAALNLSWDVNYGGGGVLGGPNIDFTVPATGTPVTFSYVAASHLLTVRAGTGLPSIKAEKGYWLNRNYLGWTVGTDPRQLSYRLYAAPTGGLAVTPTGISGGSSYQLSYDPAGLPADVKARFPAQAGLDALKVPAGTPVRDLLKGQLAVAAFDQAGNLVDATGLQLPGVLDDLNAGAANRRLGPSWQQGVPSLALWAPTARSVSVQLYRAGQDSAPVGTATLQDTGDGVWSVAGNRGWAGDYYLFDVEVYVPETGQVEHNLVTDPYSVGLSTNSQRSLLVNLDDPALAPPGWAGLPKPALPAAVDQSITELHLRDFSISDPTVPAVDRGTYEAFTDRSSNAMRYLTNLARSGLTTVHLLPLADYATVNEDKSSWQSPPCNLAALPPDSSQQQACVKQTAATDGFNWGYDPLHWTVPEGSYATDPAGAGRTREFRDMVAAINHAGLRMVMDVVYNHTTDAGQNGRNDLDRIVPGYYHRLDSSGVVQTSTCCPDTATEHLMMGKLLVDSVLTWATEYKVDGFRFDLMGHQPKALMVQLRQRLDQLTVRHDGVDGKAIYLYGEGWNFGEVANNALFVQATQANMAGTGIGTFNDRIRDAVRGGGPFDSDPRIQGFASGEYTDPNGDPVNGSAAAQRTSLLHNMDLIQVGLTGNLRDYRFTDSSGASVTGGQVDYNGQPAGYASSPQEAINYVDAHDNETLFDALTYKLPVPTSMADRIRMQTLALATTAFSQGVSFWQAGSDALRSKSFDGNSYDSGDWFNVLDPSLTVNGFGRGLPPSSSDKWSYAQPLLANPALKPAPADLRAAEAASDTLLKIRQTSPLLHLGSAALIQQDLSFPNSGANETPGVIVLRLDDSHGANVDPRLRGMVIVFNASPNPVSQQVSAVAGQRFELNSYQRTGSDPIVKQASYQANTGTFTVPGRTVAVFGSPG
jgi:pullulanase-type alpha-1,6-glucosidase